MQLKTKQCNVKYSDTFKIGNLHSMSIIVDHVDQIISATNSKLLSFGHFVLFFTFLDLRHSAISYPNRSFLRSVKYSKQPIRLRYLGHVTDYQPIRDQHFLIRSVYRNMLGVKYLLSIFSSLPSRDSSAGQLSVPDVAETEKPMSCFSWRLSVY
eukprot:sb/3473295/